jgi:NADPH:quinone reductase-like Zn-dependent oxidoreductase
LELSDVRKPQPGDDDVLIEVKASEVTKSDCEMRSFNYSVKWFWLPLRIAFGIRTPRHKILGMYFSGRIHAIGKNVRDFSIGDEVFGTSGLRLGAYGEFVAIPASYAIVDKPSNMNFAEASAVPLGGLNALHFMRRAAIVPGDKVLINGGGGSIGAYAIQIAKAMGAHVTVVDTAIKEGLIRRCGADQFIDYTQQDFTATKERYDVIFDMVPASSYSKCIKLLNPNGRYLLGNPRFLSMLRSVITTRFTDKQVRFAFAPETKSRLLALKNMIEDGQIHSIVDRIISMDEAAEGHRLVDTEQRAGAIVLHIGT